MPRGTARIGRMLIAFSVAPLGAGDSVTDAVADAVRIVRESGLPNRTDAMFTTIEGDWDEVMDVVKRATEAVGRHGERVSLVLKADIRPGRTGEMQAKLDRLQGALGGSPPPSARPRGPAPSVRQPSCACRRDSGLRRPARRARGRRPAGRGARAGLARGVRRA